MLKSYEATISCVPKIVIYLCRIIGISILYSCKTGGFLRRRTGPGVAHKAKVVHWVGL